MKTDKKVWVALVVIAIIAVGGYFFPQFVGLGASGSRFPNGISANSTSPSAGEVLGTTLAITGASDVSTFTQGGGVRATSTVNAAETLLASDFDVENVIDYTLNVLDSTLTWPASTSLSSFLPNAGDTRTITVRHATTTIAMDLTFATTTGVFFRSASSTTLVIPGSEGGNNYADFKWIRRADTDFDVLVDVYVDEI